MNALESVWKLANVILRREAPQNDKLKDFQNTL
jgi:hypothetical protein